MAALLSLLALAAATTDQPRLDPAQPADLVPAVQSCTRSVTGKVKVDHYALEADGWKQDEAKGIWIVRRKPGNAAIILANSGQSSEFPGSLMQEVCMVRARLGHAATLAAIAAKVTAFSGVEPVRSRRKSGTWLWKGASYWIGMEPFDPAADGSPVTQLAVFPAPPRRP
ncbi:hypothetical protein [Sphingomonas glaciei]|uniref:Uncharacterized protein n=1 Tax=Sphingomonas glaciei TaxID=2938948 RepID=A0ABY5MTQ9_9SPHN|nr:hypothetical protein [Sphingomonas glaciei]UUR07812.1 hypothetical protein M1K48_12895 [Sphingomonas glaciei]